MIYISIFIVYGFRRGVWMLVYVRKRVGDDSAAVRALRSVDASTPAQPLCGAQSARSCAQRRAHFLIWHEVGRPEAAILG